jgi:hypothetical protein
MTMVHIPLWVLALIIAVSAASGGLVMLIAIARTLPDRDR